MSSDIPDRMPDIVDLRTASVEDIASELQNRTEACLIVWMNEDDLVSVGWRFSGTSSNLLWSLEHAKLELLQRDQDDEEDCP